MSKEVKRIAEAAKARKPEWYALDGHDWFLPSETMEFMSSVTPEYVLALHAELEALKAELALWAPIHYEVHRRAEKEWCLSSGCDFTVTVMHDDYAAIDAALQGAQP